MMETVNQLLKQTNIDESVEQGGFDVESQELGYGEMLDVVEEFNASDGWYAFTDVCLRHDELVAQLNEKKLLSCELTNGNASLHVRHQGSGKWLVTTLKKTGGEGLLVTESFISIPKDKQLVYETWWTPQKDGITGFATLQPKASRFTGFSQKKGGNDDQA